MTIFPFDLLLYFLFKKWRWRVWSMSHRASIKTATDCTETKSSWDCEEVSKKFTYHFKKMGCKHKTLRVVATYVSGPMSSGDNSNTCPCVSTSSSSGKRGFVIRVVVQLCSICFCTNGSFGGRLKCGIITSSSQECVCSAPLIHCRCGDNGCSGGADGCGIGYESERYGGWGGYCWT